ncbi:MULTISPECIES: hypothetical protein [unclassified Nocardia]|uniref:hypothetical protein n=1 Tax=unclassified Nocardia TaxID=2637762 RepID=UPI001CE474D0|nr:MULTISPECIES: hypothetical protein [unclassified Nocardia]
MVFENVFAAGGSASDSGAIAGKDIAGYIPGEPVESVCVPPHDVRDTATPWHQDPKTVRETAPQALSIFKLVGALTGAIRTAGDKQDAFTKLPASTANAAAPIMKAAENTAHNVTDSVRDPGGWGGKPVNPDGWGTKAKPRSNLTAEPTAVLPEPVAPPVVSEPVVAPVVAPVVPEPVAPPVVPQPVAPPTDPTPSAGATHADN